MLGFSNYHPAALLLFFITAAVLTMFTQNPLLLLLSFLGAASLYGMFKGARALLRSLLFYIPFVLLLALINPLFNRQGTILLFRFGALPVTLESLFYGFSVGLMLAAVMLWFAGCSALITADCFLYLLGRPFPRLALILSSAMRFVPLFSRQAEKIHDAQKAMGMYAAGRLSDRVRQGARGFTALLTWAMESAIDTADSMEARGYGLPGASRYENRSFRRRDGFLILSTLLSLSLGAISLIRKTGAVSFFPALCWPAWSGPVAGLYILYLLFFFLPCILEGRERIRWRLLQSKM